MKADSDQILGVGVYSLSMASRISCVHPQRIRRWLRGYKFKVRDGHRKSPPVWSGQFESEGDLVLGFLDLMEVRIVDAFRSKGVPWKIIRQASEKGKTLFKTTHPFCTNRFTTDGHDLFTDIEDEAGKTITIDVAKSHRTFHQIIRPYLKGVDFLGGQVARWWPMTERREVVVDPSRSFGKPIVNVEGVPTKILADAVIAEGSAKRVAHYFDVSMKSVRDAMTYENQLNAA